MPRCSKKKRAAVRPKPDQAKIFSLWEPPWRWSYEVIRERSCSRHHQSASSERWENSLQLWLQGRRGFATAGSRWLHAKLYACRAVRSSGKVSLHVFRCVQHPFVRPLPLSVWQQTASHAYRRIDSIFSLSLSLSLSLINGFQIPIVDNARNLGVYLSSNLTWNRHISHISQSPCFPTQIEIQ